MHLLKYTALAAALLLSAALAGCGDQMGQAPAKSLSPQAASSSTVPAEKESTLVYYLPTKDGLKIQKQTLKVTAREHLAKNAIEEMLRVDKAGPYPVTPVGTRLKSINVKDGTATVDFSKELNTLQGETSQSLFTAMVVDTLTEFPNIKEVEIRVEGKVPNFSKDPSKPLKRDESYILMEKK